MTPRTTLTLSALLLLLTTAACRQPEETEPPAEAPPPQTAPAEAPVQRTQPPLPGPGEAGVSPRHGGLVATAAPFTIELVADASSATIYLYEMDGTAVTPTAASGTLTATWSGGEATIPLELASGDAGPALTGSGALPAIFTAAIELEADGRSGSAEVRWASGGQRRSGDSADQP